LENDYYAAYFDLASSSSIENLMFSGCNINGTAYGLYNDMAGTASITNYTVNNCSIDHATEYCYYLSMTGSSVIDNVTFSNSSMSFASSDYALYPGISSTESITNFTVSNCVFNTNEGYAMYLTPEIANAYRNVTISNCTFLSGAGAYQIYIDGAGSLGNLDINNNTFTSCQYPTYLDCNTTIFSMTNNTFNGNEEAYVTLFSLEQGYIANNQFNGNTFYGMQVGTTGNASLSIVGNTFTGAVLGGQGYGVSLGPTAGTLCLDFFGNVTTPSVSGTYSAYYLNGGAGGTLNLTPRSTQANNIGAIDAVSTGSCAQ
jgi:hypothetical protein